MEAKVIFHGNNEATVMMSDGGVAYFYHNGDYMLTEYYQDRFIPEETPLEEGQTMWDVLGEGKMYIKDWEAKQEIDDEMIQDAVDWLAPMFEVSIKKINQP